MNKEICLYTETKEKINFKELKKFVSKEFKVNLEIKKIKKSPVFTKGIILDLFNTQSAIHSFIKKNIYPIVLTDKLFANFDENQRLHIRSSVYASFGAIISTSGIVEGPAKPKNFYFYKQKYLQLGTWDLYQQKIKEKFKNKFIDYHDKKLTQVLKGYLSQAIFFYLSENPFCTKKTCRLFNSHWQEDLIYSQIKIGKFCKKHKNYLKKLKGA